MFAYLTITFLPYMTRMMFIIENNRSTGSNDDNYKKMILLLMRRAKVGFIILDNCMSGNCQVILTSYCTVRNDQSYIFISSTPNGRDIGRELI